MRIHTRTYKHTHPQIVYHVWGRNTLGCLLFTVDIFSGSPIYHDMCKINIDFSQCQFTKPQYTLPTYTYAETWAYIANMCFWCLSDTNGRFYRLCMCIDDNRKWILPPSRSKYSTYTFNHPIWYVLLCIYVPYTYTWLVTAYLQIIIDMTDKHL